MHLKTVPSSENSNYTNCALSPPKKTHPSEMKMNDVNKTEIMSYGTLGLIGQ